MNEELFRNKLMISSPTSISLGHITWFALDTKLVGRVKALLEERDNLQSKIDKAIECLVNNIDLEMDDFTKIDLGCDVLKILDLDKYNEFLKEDK